MTGKHYNWHKSWRVDLKAATASHDSGLTVRFVEGLILPRPEVGCQSYAEEVGEWTGVPDGGDEWLQHWLASNPNLRDVKSIKNRLQRLMEEAGRVWARAQKEKFDES